MLCRFATGARREEQTTKYFVDVYEELRIIPFNLLKPTNSELKILQVLWTRGPSTVRDVHSELGGETGYTTVLKLMQIMAEKGLVRRNQDARSHIFEAAASEAETKKGLVGDLIEKAFSGSARDLILQALSARKTSPDELSEIRRLIEEMERKKP